MTGGTYVGQYIFAYVIICLPAAPDPGMLLAGATGFALLSPLPGGCWIMFVNRDEDDTSPDCTR